MVGDDTLRPAGCIGASGKGSGAECYRVVVGDVNIAAGGFGRGNGDEGGKQGLWNFLGAANGVNPRSATSLLMGRKLPRPWVGSQ